MNVGSKLFGLIFGVAVLIIMLLLFLSSPLVRIFGIEPIFQLDLKIEVSSLISTLTVLVLVWERLRESKDRALDSINENVLRALWGALNPNQDPYRLSVKEMEKSRDYLKRFGRFLGVISLHPIKWKRFDRFISLLEPFEENLKRIDELAEEELGETVEREKFLKRLDFEVLSPSQMDPKKEREYTRVALKLQKEQRKLIDDTKRLTKDLEKIRKEIYENLDKFLKENHLSILTHWRSLQ